jgi:protein arginine kinase activator
MTPQAILSALIKKEGEQAARHSEEQDRQCPTCGLPLRSYRETLFLGCSDCYSAFEAAVVHDLRRYHGAVQHCGRTPEKDAAMVEPRLAIRDLQRRLEVAVRREDFELAARLRDEIKRLKAQLQEAQSSPATNEQ